MLDAGVATICPKHEPIEALLAAVRAVAAGGVLDLGTGRAATAVGPAAEPSGTLPPGAAGAAGLRRGHAADGCGGPAVHHPDTAAQYVKRIRRKYDEVGRDTHTKSSLYRAAITDGFLEVEEGQPEV